MLESWFRTPMVVLLAAFAGGSPACGGDDLMLPGDANPARLELVGGDGQSGPAGAELPEPLVARLTDEFGNPLAGVTITWSPSGGGSVSAASTRTDDDGRASTRWTLGAAGGQTLNAVVSGIGVVAFTATATGGGGGGGGGDPADATRLAFLVQPSDTEEDERISPAVQVMVLDAAGRRVSGAAVTVRVELEGEDDGRLRGDRSQRTEAGIATFDDLEVDREGEDYRLRAVADGLDPAVSSAFDIDD